MAAIGPDDIVTVIGGSGFIGRYVVEKLAETGCRIRVAVRRPERALFLKPLGDLGQIEPVAVNIRHRASLESAIFGASAVVNLVGILFESGAQRFAAVQAAGAGTVAEVARSAGVARLVHVSAIGADPASPAAYARSKADGEARVRTAFPAATILRPSIVFGPEDNFLNRFAGMAALSPVLPVVGGKTRFQPVYVGDVAQAVVAALQQPGAAGGLYELGGPHVYAFRDLLKRMLVWIDRRRYIIDLPFAIASLQAAFLQLLPTPPLTLDQVRMLRRDNIVAPGAKGLADLDITPTPVEMVAPLYLARYRHHAPIPGQ
ncbi:MAG TPA: complex I NDUFA9 subunit family protein [Dongiaceae bacterium]|nr:complex I NDUFA9 subunit family protein [Dongiaceae bacterium]